ncbi:hypothetical protein G4B88_016809 [Cannabis sativa]|uniref:CSN8/PSMD8/EIF3K domain-containing protein n=1 Tax=Cannabis sativa TaxID=3483 RepID=A0A7J6GMX2_CANSA|nr:hypothetical protein G4B88_016809 [Cannabis sativa]
MDFSTLSEALESKSYAKIADICDNLMLQVAAEGIPYQDEWPYAIHLLGHIYSDDTNSARFLWKSIPAAIKDNQPELLAAWKIGQKLWVRDYGGVHEAIRGFDWSQQVQGLVAAFSGKSLQNLILSICKAFSNVLLFDYNLVTAWISWSWKFQSFYLWDFSVFPELFTIESSISWVARKGEAELYTQKMFQLLQSAYSTISIQDTALFLGMNEDNATNYVVQQGWILDAASQMLTVKKQPLVKEQKLDPSKLQNLTEYVFYLEH